MGSRAGWLTIILMAVAIAAAGQDRHPIDVRQSACLDKSPSTQGSIECERAAEVDWDKELNRAYRELQASLSPQAKTALTLTQRAWIKYRDEEFKTIDLIYGAKDGTMYLPMLAGRRMRVVRSRALELLDFLELQKM